MRARAPGWRWCLSRANTQGVARWSLGPAGQPARQPASRWEEEEEEAAAAAVVPGSCLAVALLPLALGTGHEAAAAAAWPGGGEGRGPFSPRQGLAPASVSLPFFSGPGLVGSGHRPAVKRASPGQPPPPSSSPAPAGGGPRAAPSASPSSSSSSSSSSPPFPSSVLPPSSMSPPPRGAHPIRAPPAHSSPLGARPRPLLFLPLLLLLLLRRRRRLLRARLRRPSRDGGGQAAVGPPAATMKAEAGDDSLVNLSVQQVLSLWAHGTALRHLTEMWYWVFLWALFSSLFVHGAAGVLMFVMLQRHRQGRLISIIVISIGFLGSLTGAMITSAAVAGIYRVAGKSMAPLEALVFGVGQTVLTLIISFSRILATL